MVTPVGGLRKYIPYPLSLICCFDSRLRKRRMKMLVNSIDDSSAQIRASLCQVELVDATRTEFDPTDPAHARRRRLDTLLERKSLEEDVKSRGSSESDSSSGSS